MKSNINKVLLTNSSGLPIKWVTPEIAVVYHCKELVNYSFGDETLTLFGGVNKSNVVSRIDLKPIISVQGFNHCKFRSRTPHVKNSVLFARDGYKCAYCNNEFAADQLSKDHIIPVSRGGKNTWVNLITACKRCNSNKGNKHLQDFGKMHFDPINLRLQDSVFLKGLYDMTKCQFDYLKNFVSKELLATRDVDSLFQRRSA